MQKQRESSWEIVRTNEYTNQPWSGAGRWAGFISFALCPATGAYLPGSTGWAERSPINGHFQRCYNAPENISTRRNICIWLYTLICRSGRDSQHAGALSVHPCRATTSDQRRHPHHHGAPSGGASEDPAALSAEALDLPAYPPQLPGLATLWRDLCYRLEPLCWPHSRRDSDSGGKRRNAATGRLVVAG